MNLLFAIVNSLFVLLFVAASLICSNIRWNRQLSNETRTSSFVEICSPFARVKLVFEKNICNFCPSTLERKLMIHEELKNKHLFISNLIFWKVWKSKDVTEPVTRHDVMVTFDWLEMVATPIFSNLIFDIWIRQAVQLKAWVLVICPFLITGISANHLLIVRFPLTTIDFEIFCVPFNLMYRLEVDLLIP